MSLIHVVFAINFIFGVPVHMTDSMTVEWCGACMLTSGERHNNVLESSNVPFLCYQILIHMLTSVEFCIWVWYIAYKLIVRLIRKYVKVFPSGDSQGVSRGSIDKLLWH